MVLWYSRWHDAYLWRSPRPLPWPNTHSLPPSFALVSCLDSFDLEPIVESIVDVGLHLGSWPWTLVELGRVYDDRPPQAPNQEGFVMWSTIHDDAHLGVSAWGSPLCSFYSNRVGRRFPWHVSGFHVFLKYREGEETCGTRCVVLSAPSLAHVEYITRMKQAGGSWVVWLPEKGIVSVLLHACTYLLASTSDIGLLYSNQERAMFGVACHVERARSASQAVVQSDERNVPETWQGGRRIRGRGAGFTVSFVLSSTWVWRKPCVEMCRWR